MYLLTLDNFNWLFWNPKLLKGSSYFLLSVEKFFGNCTLSYHNCVKVGGFPRKKEMLEANPEVSRGANHIALYS